MKKFLISLLALVIVLIVIYSFAIITLNHIVSPRTYRRIINHVVSERIGKGVKTRGKIELSTFPWLGISGKNIEISNPADFKNETKKPYLLRAQNFTINFSVWSLLFGKIVPKSIRVENATINLITLPSGKQNWRSSQPIKQPQVNNQVSKPAKLAPQKADKAFTIPTSAFHPIAINIKNTTVNLINLKTQKTISLKKLSLNTSALGIKRDIDFKSQFRLITNKPELDLTANLSANIKNLGAQNFDIKMIRFVGKIYRYQRTFTKPLDVNFETKGKLNLQNNKLNIPSINLKVDDTKLAGSLYATDFQTSLKANGNFKASNINVKNIKNINAKGNYTIANKTVNINNLTATSKKSHLTGNITYRYENTKQLNFNIKLNQLTLPNIKKEIKKPKATSQPKKQAGNNKKQQPATSNNADSDNEPTAAIPALKSFASEMNWIGSLQIGKLFYNKVALNNFKINTTNSNGLITVYPLSANINQGNINFKININTIPAQPVIHASVNINNVPSQSITQLLNHKLKFTGLVNFNTNIQSITTDEADFLKNLNGQGQLQISDGKLLGVNFGQQFNRGLSFLKKSVSKKIPNVNFTVFSLFKTNIHFKQGLMHNSNILLQSPNFSATGQGAANLTTNRIQYHFVITSSQFGGVQIPIAISGSFAHPRVGLDVENIGKLLKSKPIQKEIDKSINNFFRGKLFQ